MQQLCRHLALPHLLPITQKSEKWSQFYGDYEPFAKDLAMNSQALQHGWKGCTRIDLTWLPALTGTIWQPGMAAGNLRLLCLCVHEIYTSRRGAKDKQPPSTKL
jgi:hypothetical protein